MKTVIYACFAFSFSVPDVNSLRERLTFPLYDEIYMTRRSAVCGRDMTSFEVIRGDRPPERHIKVSVHVYPPRNDIFTGCVNYAVCVIFDRLSDFYNYLFINENISIQRAVSVDQFSVFY